MSPNGVKFLIHRPRYSPSRTTASLEGALGKVIYFKTLYKLKRSGSNFVRLRTPSDIRAPKIRIKTPYG